jgi:hypothetical protein
MARFIETYQVAWNSSIGRGHFWFVYNDGTRHRTEPVWGVDANSFRILIDILRNERPVFGDHTTATVVTWEEEVGEEASGTGRPPPEES